MSKESSILGRVTILLCRIRPRLKQTMSLDCAARDVQHKIIEDDCKTLQVIKRKAVKECMSIEDKRYLICFCPVPKMDQMEKWVISKTFFHHFRGVACIKWVWRQVGINDSVIIVTHEPSWLLDWYWHDCTGKNVSHLIQDHLKGRCRIRMAGDLHHYMRHSALPSGKPVYVQHLLVNGCGGAFLHPTHTFSNFRQFLGTCYENKVAYPPYEDSKRIALGNILKFRKKNWQFDVIGGIIYFVLVFSIFPQGSKFKSYERFGRVASESHPHSFSSFNPVGRGITISLQIATLRPLCTFCLARTIYVKAPTSPFLVRGIEVDRFYF
eukprot:Gb_09079 [translate_table: standard]